MDVPLLINQTAIIFLQLDLLSSIASLINSPPPPQNTSRYFSEEENATAMDLAVSCGQELAKMCETNEPLWNQKRSGKESVSLTLNEEEYKKMFQWPITDDDHFRREASRANEVVLMNSMTLVNTFLDAVRRMCS